MQNKLYVGNLSYNTTNDDLTQLFSPYGTVIEAKVISDRYSGRSKGFGFVTFETDEAAQSALVVDGTEFQGRNLKVNVAKEEEARTGGGSRGGRSGGGSGGGSRGGFRSGGGEKRW